MNTNKVLLISVASILVISVVIIVMSSTGLREKAFGFVSSTLIQPPVNLVGQVARPGFFFGDLYEDCKFNGKTVPFGESVTAYRDSQVVSVTATILCLWSAYRHLYTQQM